MNRWVAAGLLLLANTLWGTSWTVAKVALDQLPWPLLGAIRFSIASGLLWVIILVQGRFGARRGPLPAPGIARKDALRLLALGLVAIAANHLIANFGQSLTTATDASLMIVGEVIFTTLLGALILKERPGRWKQVGVLIGAAGAVTLILSRATGGAATGGLLRAAGDLLILLSLPLEALYSILGTHFSRRYDRLKVTALINTGSLVIWVPILIWYIANGRFPWGAWGALGGVVYLAVVNSVICFLIWFKVLESAGSNMGAISLFAQPLVGAALGLTLLHEHITPGLLAGGGLILGALLFSTLPDRAPAPANAAAAAREHQ
ncbi:MAG: family transporter [Symbiobacteriaceae bacterium]|jgi:drug/metabolite transporter (DMT)-like permease|nr:family transporter [Symbiobacteriaceae bacterium]